MHHRQTITLRDKRLFREYAYINGKWSASSQERLIPVSNPANGELLGHVPDMTKADCVAAIDAASTAWPAWRDLLPQQRGEILQNWYALILEHREDLALLITLEQGKPLSEARGEIDYAASFVQWFAGEALRVNGLTINGHLPDRDMQVRQEPIGVTAAVTPWNFPCAMITRKAAAALAAGCPMLVRPASETPLSALALAELADRAGIPAGVFSVLTGDIHIVETLCRHADVRAVSFTGSTRVGKILLGHAADSVKRMSLELGGHAPFILFDDMDLQTGVSGAIDAKFQTSGQDCQAANRIYVQENQADAFIAEFTRRVQALKVGEGRADGVQIGPLINRAAVEKCQQHVDDALAKGARLLCGGEVHAAGRNFYQPTVLADVTADMLISREETFGPVAAITTFRAEEDLHTAMNHPQYGLMAYLYTRDHDRIARLSRRLEYGMVAVNCVKVTGHPVPFGGYKQSGLGREGGHWGLEEFTETKYICARYQAA